MAQERTRRAAVAGSFYPAVATALRQELERCFLHAAGPGYMPSVSQAPLSHTLGVVVPHAGYQYSGATAARAFAALAERGTPEVAVILGPNHRGLGPALAVPEATAWETPLGRVPVHQGLATALLREMPQVRRHDGAHEAEHSLEVELPFLQHLYGDALPILPVAVADQGLGLMTNLGEALVRLLSSTRAALIASSDLTHYLPDAEVRRRDRLALNAIVRMDARLLNDVVEREGITMCGVGPAMAMLTACLALGASRATELGHTTSADATGETSWAVGYGAVLVE